MPIIHAILLAALAGLLLAASARAHQAVPDLLKLAKFADDWQVIASSQTLERTPGAPKKTLLEVEDYFKIGRRDTYSRIRDVSANKNYAVLNHKGQTFVLDESGECQLDLRHDHTTMFPWRGRCNHYGMLLTSFNVLGLAGLWLNAMENNAACSRIDAQFMQCFYGRNNLGVSVELKFRWPQRPGEERLAALVGGLVEQRRTISSESGALFHDVRTSFQVTAARSSLDGAEIAHIETAIDACKHLLGSRPIFPSLMRELTKAKRRDYALKYSLVLYDYPDGTTKRPSKGYSISEWFSYDREAQTLERLLGQERFYRLLDLRGAQSKSTACYRLKFGRQRQPDECQLADFHDDMLLVSGMMERKMHFVHPQTSGSQTTTFKYHTGTLIGLGALLMNLADIQYKQVKRDDAKATISNGVGALDTFIVKGHRPGQRISLRFSQLDITEHGEYSLASLQSVSIHQIADQKALDNDGQDLSNAQLLMEINIDLLQTSPPEQEMLRAFTLPSICPHEQLEEAVDDSAATIGQLPTQTSGEDNFMDAIEQPYPFPAFEEHLELSRDYSIESRWSSDGGGSIELMEYFMFEEVDEQGQDFHFARLDVTEVGAAGQESRYKYFVSYVRSAIIRVAGADCAVRPMANLWLDKLSSKFLFAGRDLTDDGAPTALRQYGVGGLWTLGSRSANIEFVGEFEQNADEKYTLWHLDEQPELPGVTLVFNFTRVAKKSEDREPDFRINSIRATLRESAEGKEDTSIMIIPSKVVSGTISSVHFLLPPVCSSALESEYFSRMPKFPKFSQLFGGRPSDVSFNLVYDLAISRESTSHFMRVTEANRIDSTGLGLIWVKFDVQSFYLWIRPTGETLLEQPTTNKCKLAPDPAKFIQLSDFLDAIINGEKEIGDSWCNFLLANIWNLLSARSELDGLTVDVDRKFQNGEHARLFQWSTENEHHRIAITFQHSHEDNKLHLESVTFNKGSDDFATFKVSSIDKDSSKLKRLHMSAECNESQPDKRFPRLRDQFTFGDVLHIKSEYVKRSVVKGIDRFLIDEWLRVGSSIRTKIVSPEEATSRPLADYLVYNTTEEFFDLTEEFHCGSNIASDLHLEIEAADWMTDSLFECNNKAAFYGPLSLWTLAGRATMKTELIHSKANLLNLYARPDILNDWFSSEHWLVTHPNKESLNFELVFNLDQQETRHIVLDRLEATDWHALMANDGTLLDDKVSVNLLQEFDYSEQDSRKVLNNFLIPPGHGCKRGGSFKPEVTLQAKNDAILFDPLIPTEFYYEASLRLLGPETRPVEPVVISGYFGRCPETWNSDAYGGVQVRGQRRHFIDGTIESETSMSCKEKLWGESTERRVLDDIRGVCSISRDPNKHDELMQLDFGAKINITNKWIYFATSTNSEPIQFVEGDFTNQWRDKVVYESQLETVNFGANLEGPGFIVRTFERDLRRELYGSFFHHSDVDVDVYLTGKAHLSLKIRNLQSKLCWEILKRAPTESCYESTNSRLASGDLNPPNRVREFSIAFEPQHGESLENFNSKRVAAEACIIDALMTLKEGYLTATQIGHINVQLDHKDRILANIRLVSRSPASDRFVQVPGFGLKRQPSLGSIKSTDSARGCSNFCESLGECFAFSYCKDRECRILNIYSLISDKIVDEHQIDKVNFTDHLRSAMKVENDCITYYSPTGRPIRTLESAVELIKQQSELGRITINLMNESKFKLVKYASVEYNEIISFNGRRINVDKSSSKFSYHILGTDEQIAVTKLQTTTTGLKTQLVYSDSETNCLNYCSDISCDLVSFCTIDRQCTVVSNLLDWNTYNRVLKEATEPKPSCTVLTQDYLSSFNRFSNTHEPKKFMTLVEDASLFECASRCHFAEGRLEATDCLSFDYCPQGQTDHQSTSTGKCYLQKLHLVMNEFDESILRQISKDSESPCSHYSKSLIADYRLQKERRFKERHGIVLHGTTIDNCALICRRNHECSAFEYCRSHKDERQTTCYISGLKKSALEEDSTAITNSPVCNIYNLKHFDVELDAVLMQQGDLLTTSGSGFIGFVYVCGYLIGSASIGLVLGVAYNKITGQPLQLPIPLTRNT